VPARKFWARKFRQRADGETDLLERGAPLGEEALQLAHRRALEAGRGALPVEDAEADRILKREPAQLPGRRLGGD
jgi:hypothetical protein